MESLNVLLIFSKEIMYKPIIYRVARDFNIEFNVLEAKILPKQEGRITLELKGSSMEIKETLNYLKTEGVEVQKLADQINRDESKCVHCGACTAVCRVEALFIDRSDNMKVIFSPEKCIACGLCMKACPVDAMSGAFIDKAI